MTVKVTQPAINLREKLAEVDQRKINSDDILDGAITNEKINWYEHDLAPYFENIYYTGGANPTYNMVFDGGSTISSNNGNNGPSVVARLRGTAKGMFFLDWTPGYSWGWSEILLTTLDNWNESTCSYRSQSPVGSPYIWIANNSSNNQSRCDYWNGYTSTTIYSNPGLNGQRFKLWRNDDNVLKIYNGTSTVTVTTLADDLVIRAGAQSPFSITINGAMKLAAGNVV